MALLLGPTTQGEGSGPSAEVSHRRILVVSKTTGFRHTSIPDAIAAVERLGAAGGSLAADHPISWCQFYDGGRVWYTAMGHAAETYGEPLFVRHLLGGVQFAAGYPDCDGRPARTLEPRLPPR